MSAETLDSPRTPPKVVRLHPNFVSALRGVWLITWKSQATWRRFLGTALGLFALPALVYLTTPSPLAWARSHRLDTGNPSAYLSGFFKRLARAGTPLQPEQQTALIRIVTEEFARAEKDWDTQANAEPSSERQRAQMEQCNERILRRVEPLLNERQFSQFQAQQARHRRPGAAPGDFAWGRTTPFYHCLIQLYFFIILPLNCVRMCGAVIRDELEADTLSFLITRPLSRARLLMVKFISQTLWLQIWLLAQTLLLFAVGAIRRVPDLGALLPLFLGVQVLAVLAWSALGLFLGQISKRYMALALLYGAIVEMGIGRIPTNINSLSLMRHLQTLLAHNPVLQNIFHWPEASLSTPVTALILAPAVFLSLAAYLFTILEYHHTTEMQR